MLSFRFSIIFGDLFTFRHTNIVNFHLSIVKMPFCHILTNKRASFPTYVCSHVSDRPICMFQQRNVLFHNYCKLLQFTQRTSCCEKNKLLMKVFYNAYNIALWKFQTLCSKIYVDKHLRLYIFKDVSLILEVHMHVTEP